ncbi:unnamed protein product [Cuscuta epithymum]|uniref:procollagen-proline 4-dioxygenase n=1 Tax=Cuscuta epithymum TaxID=186058 RepID=A0AAV0C2G8_9ASTE|nr:unnamed protein product [Cuscuta epithymum]
MVRLLPALILAALASNLDVNFLESRKELRIKQVIQDKDVKLGQRMKSTLPDPTQVVQLSWQPRVFLYRGFLSEEECDHLMDLVHAKHNSSAENGASDYSNVEKDEIVAGIEEKISAWTFLPKENGKPFKVFHNEFDDPEKKYSYFDNNSTEVKDAPLMATVILYLSNITAGGHILFPESRSKVWSKSNCGESSNSVRPTKGNALLFFNVNLNATPDNTSTHVRCAVIEGEMAYAIKLFYPTAVTREKEDPIGITSTDCTDEDDSCPRWADIGECDRNPVFMVGSPDYYGTCRKSCNAC